MFLLDACKAELSKSLPHVEDSNVQSAKPGSAPLSQNRRNMDCDAELKEVIRGDRALQLSE